VLTDETLLELVKLKINQIYNNYLNER